VGVGPTESRVPEKTTVPEKAPRSHFMACATRVRTPTPDPCRCLHWGKACHHLRCGMRRDHGQMILPKLAPRKQVEYRNKNNGTVSVTDM
jgi:hypothetical protein